MKEKKKKIDTIWVLIFLGFMVICFFAYWTSIRDNKYKEDFIKLDEQVEIGIVREFTQEEIENFKEKALNEQKKFLRENDIKPGDDFTTQSYNVGEPINAFIVDEDGKVVLDSKNYSLLTYTGIKAMEKGTFRDNEIIFSDVFKDDFNFKRPDIFYGFASVGDKFPDYSSDPHFEYRNNLFVNSFVPGLKTFDKKYSNSDDGKAGEIIEKGLAAGEGDVSTQTLSLDENILPSPINRQAVSKYLELKNKPSVIPLIGYLSLKPSYFHFLNKDHVSPPAAYQPFPNEYNYFNEKNNYFTIFYPTSIEKIDKRTYVVNVTVEDPVDAVGAVQIFNQINSHFINMSVSVKEYNSNNDVPFILCVKINNKDDLDGELLQNLPYDVVNSSYRITGQNKWSNESIYESLTQKPGWYPNTEAQVWVKSFFNKLNIAIKNNTEFSITNAIKQISEEHNKEYNTVENVIFSYFWYCIS